MGHSLRVYRLKSASGGGTVGATNARHEPERRDQRGARLRERLERGESFEHLDKNVARLERYATMF